MTHQCQMYRNLDDVRLTCMSRGYSKDFPDLLACDGKHHYRFKGDGRDYVMAYRDDKGQPHLALCPDYKGDDVLPSEIQAGDRHVEQTFATFHGDDVARDAVSSLPDNPTTWTVILNGRVGRGKTHLARALERQCRDAHRSCAFTTAVDLAKLFRQSQEWNDDRDERYDAEEKLTKMIGCAVIIIDDLGEERVETDNFRDQFKGFLDRVSGHLLVTTNLPIVPLDAYERMSEQQRVGTLNERLGDRIISRLFMKHRIVTLKGSDHRQKERF